MMKHSFAAQLSVALMLAMASPAAHAAPARPNQPIGEADVLSGKVTRDPEMGYILVGGIGGAMGTFMRFPDDVTRTAWEQDRSDALAKALKKYPAMVSDWQFIVDSLKKNGSKGPYPPKPVEPTIDSVEVVPLDMRDMITFGPQFRFTKGARTSFLTTAKPGVYYWVGVPSLPCMCMGTVQFEVKAGQVTNLGNMLWALPQQKQDLTVAQLEAINAADMRAKAGKPARPDAYASPDLDMTVPDSLKDWPVVTAELHAHGKFNNYGAAIVSRLAPIPGVLSYRRDTVIDERTGQALPNPKLVSMQKPKL